MKILLIGLGTVGQAFYNLLKNKGLADQVKYIVVKDPFKTRGAPEELIHFNWQELINDPELDVVVELIDDAEVAREIADKALSLGKHYISANKKMLAENLASLQAKKPQQTELLFEAAVAGAIPIVKTLQSYFEAGEVLGIEGILNGSTNYILEEIAKGNSYDLALAKAQSLGFAESDPFLDVSGWDATYKLSLITQLTGGPQIPPQAIERSGLNSLKTLIPPGRKPKLIASWQVDGSNTKVGLEYLPLDHPLAQIPAEENAILIHTENGGSYLLRGKGAGAKPTAWAVYSDLKKLLERSPALV